MGSDGAPLNIWFDQEDGLGVGEAPRLRCHSLRQLTWGSPVDYLLCGTKLAVGGIWLTLIPQDQVRHLDGRIPAS